mmetsp:Transcript_307/g.753  ORF Transcript_307/g.753 Transcript_307/m.753 type:complete len:332 (-) Transcript_307:269-1264(-)
MGRSHTTSPAYISLNSLVSKPAGCPASCANLCAANSMAISRPSLSSLSGPHTTDLSKGMNLSSSSIGRSQSHFAASGMAQLSAARPTSWTYSADARIVASNALSISVATSAASKPSSAARSSAILPLTGFNGLPERISASSNSFSTLAASTVRSLQKSAKFTPDSSYTTAARATPAVSATAFNVLPMILSAYPSSRMYPSSMPSPSMAGGPAILVISASSANDRCPSAIGPANMFAKCWGERGWSHAKSSKPETSAVIPAFIASVEITDGSWRKSLNTDGKSTPFLLNALSDINVRNSATRSPSFANPTHSFMVSIAAFSSLSSKKYSMTS